MDLPSVDINIGKSAVTTAIVEAQSRASESDSVAIGRSHEDLDRKATASNAGRRERMTSKPKRKVKLTRRRPRASRVASDSDSEGEANNDSDRMASFGYVTSQADEMRAISRLRRQARTESEASCSISAGRSK